jgi:hypothetical protein
MSDAVIIDSSHVEWFVKKRPDHSEYLEMRCTACGEMTEAMLAVGAFDFLLDHDGCAVIN